MHIQAISPPHIPPICQKIRPSHIFQKLREDIEAPNVDLFLAGEKRRFFVVVDLM
jgi:hypothetical protein